MNAKGRAARRVPDADCPGEWPCAPRWAHCRTGQWGRGYRALHPAQGILRCLHSQTTMCFLFPRTLDQAIPGSRSQHWRGITQRAGNGSHKRCASISCPPFLRGNWVVGGQFARPFQVLRCCEESCRCCYTGVLADLFSAGVLVSAGVVL